MENLMAQINSTLKNLQTTVTDKLNEPIKIINDLEGRLQKIFDDSIAMLKKQYQNEEEKFIGDVIKILDCYKKEADKLGVNIKDCYSKAQDQMLGLPEEFLKNINKCATSEYDSAMVKVKSALDIYNSVMNDLNGFPDRIRTCAAHGVWYAPVYLTGVLKDITALILKVSTDYAQKLVAVATELGVIVTCMPASILACGTKEITALGDKATGISRDFLLCVKDKFPNPVQCLPA